MSDPNQSAGGQPGWGQPPGWGQQGWGQPPPGWAQPPPPGYGAPPGYQPAGYIQPLGYQRTPPPNSWFDQESGLYLPNGTTLAGGGRRVGSWFLGVLLLLVTGVIGYLIWSVILWPGGRTPKYQVLGMRCVKTSEATVARFGVMALREIVGCWLAGNVVGHIVSLVLLLTRQDRRAIPDLISDTIVVCDPDRVLKAQLA